MSKVLKIIAAVAVIYFAPQLSGFILGAGASAATAAALTSTIIAVGASVALSTVSQMIMGTGVPKSQLSRLNVTLETTTPRKAVFGTTAMNLDLRYHEASGADQEYIDYVIALAAHKVKSIDQIWFEEKLAWTASSGVTSTYAGYLTVNTITEGSASNYFTVNSGTNWGASQRLTGCAQVKIRVKRSGNTKEAESPLLNGMPSRVTIIGDGALLYDPRKDSTVPGGSGTHRANDQTTWGNYTNADDTDNPALQLLWYLLGWKVNGELSIGCGVPANRIDLPSFITAANICDENVTLAIGGTQKRYRTSGTASDSDDRMSVINTFLSSMNGTLRDSGGKLSLTIIKNDLADYVLTFDENDVLNEFEWNQTRGLNDTYTKVRGRYVDPSDNSLYQLVDYPEIEVAGGALDGIDRVMTLDLAYVEDGRRAQRIAKQVLQRNQYKGMFNATFTAKAQGCVVGDVVRLTFPALGWTNKLFRVVSQQIRFDGQVPLVLIEENAAIYAWDNDDSAPVSPNAPTVYDPLNNPIIRGIADATAGISGYLTNEAITLAADSSGNVISFDTATGTFKMFDGTTDVTTTSVFALTASSGITASINSTTGAYSVTAMSASTGSATFTGTYNGTTITKILSVAKSQQGASATSAYLTKESVQLWAYANGVVVSYAPATGSFKVFSGTTDVSSNFTLSTVSNPQALTVSYVGQTYSITGGLDAGEDTATLTIRATGTGAYTGQTFDKIFTIAKATGGYEIVSSLPVSNLFDGRIVYLNTNGKLYRYVSGTGWTAATAAADLTGQITSTQITDGAISTPKLAAGSVDTSKLTASAVTADKIAAGSITAAKVGTNEIVALSANIKDGVIETAKIGDLQVSTLKIANFAVNAVSSAKIASTPNVAAGGNSGNILQITFNKLGGTESNILIQVNAAPVSARLVAFMQLQSGHAGTLAQAPAIAEGANNNAIAACVPMSLYYVDTGLTAGTYTYWVSFDNPSTQTLLITNYVPVTLTVQEVKK